MGFLIDTCIWIDVEQGTLAPADIAAITGNTLVYYGADIMHAVDELAIGRRSPERTEALPVAHFHPA